MNGRDRRARIANLKAVKEAYKARECDVGGWPPLLMVEPVSRCTCRCRLCPVALKRLRRDEHVMCFDRYRSLLESAYPYVCSLDLWNYGEPFLHDQIVDMFRLADEMAIESVCSTNGSWLKSSSPSEKEAVLASGLKALIVALDGATAETHSSYRVGSDFQDIVDGVAELVRIRNATGSCTPVLELQCIVMRHNAHEIPAVVELAKRLGVDRLTLKSVNLTIGRDPSQPGSGGVEYARNAEAYLPDAPELGRYTEVPSRPIDMHDCSRLWKMMIVNSDGKVAVCCRDLNGEVVGRSAFSERLDAIWNGPEYIEFRRTLSQRGRQTLQLCQFCTEGRSSVLRSVEYGRSRSHYLKQDWLEQRTREEEEAFGD